MYIPTDTHTLAHTHTRTHTHTHTHTHTLAHIGHDPNDYEIGKRFNLETINIMNKVRWVPVEYKTNELPISAWPLFASPSVICVCVCARPQ